MTQDRGPSDGYGDGDDPDEAVVSVVSIDRRDDVGLICGRVDTAPSYWVILNAPRGNRAITTDLGMNRLRRHVEESGRAVAIATRSPGLSARARAAGIPVASKPEFVRWDAPGKVVMRFGDRSVAFPALGRYLQAAFLGVVLVVMLGLLAAMGPSADIVVYPATTTLTKTIQVRASAEITDLDLDTLEAPVTLVTSAIDMTIPLTVTGTAAVPTEPSSVTLSISNTTAQPVTLPAGTVVVAQSLGYEFATSDEQTVNAGATLPVAARSLLPGASQNVAANAITAFAEPREGLTVSNAAAATGGADTAVPAVSSDDIVRLRELQASIRESAAVRGLLAAERPHDAVFTQTAEAEGQEIGELPEVGTRVDVLFVPYRITVTASAIDAATLETIARHVLRDELATGVFLPGSVTATEVPGSALVADGTLSATFEVSGLFADDIDEAAVKDAVKGKSPADARSILQERYGIQDVAVDLNPRWAPWTPRFGFRIDVEFRGEEETESGEPADEGTQEEDETTARDPG